MSARAGAKAAANAKAASTPVRRNEPNWKERFANERSGWFLRALAYRRAPVCLPGRSIVLAAGRLVPQKGFDRLIEAFANIHGDHPNWDLVILGAGPDRQVLEIQRDKLGLNGRVFLPGRAGNVADWYGRASIFAMASLFEGFPNALLEAMAYGLPVISTDCDTGPRDLIEHDANGLLVTQGDQSALIAGLRQLMDNEDLRSRLSQNARAVIQKFAVERISRQWYAVFDGIGCNRQLISDRPSE